MKFDTVVVATDFSEESLFALETACSLAEAASKHLHLIHVLDLPGGFDPMGTVGPSLQELREESEKRLTALVPSNPNLNVECAVLIGEPSKKIAEFAADHDADLLVAGTHGRSGIARVLLGSTAEALLRRSPCPVLVAKQRNGTR